MEASVVFVLLVLVSSDDDTPKRLLLIEPIVLSLYALVRNCYNPETGKLRITEHEIEKEGHLDGNLCRTRH